MTEKLIRNFLIEWLNEVLTELEFNNSLLKDHLSPKHEPTETVSKCKSNFCENKLCVLKQNIVDEIGGAISELGLLHLEFHLKDALQQMKRLKNQKHWKNI